MKQHILQVLRIVSCTVSFVLVYTESPYCWIAVVPWAILNIIGIALALPLILIIGMGAGAAQADWMSDEFIYILVFILPTVLAVSASTIFRWFRNRNRSAAEGAEQTGAGCPLQGARSPTDNVRQK